eukprot:Gb_40849 [translate_table: standard]
MLAQGRTSTEEVAAWNRIFYLFIMLVLFKSVDIFGSLYRRCRLSTFHFIRYKQLGRLFCGLLLTMEYLATSSIREELRKFTGIHYPCVIFSDFIIQALLLMDTISQIATT